MKLRQFLLGSAMMFLTFVSANAVTPLLPSPLITEDKILGSAYYDTLSILSTANECSDFFGGTLSSVDIFNGLIGNVQKGHFSSLVGIRMSGDAVRVFNLITKSKYRLFNKVSINTNGPFYRQRNSMAQPSVAGVGSFEPNTKQARVLMFLHELGHVIQGEGGNWLLPDDGRDVSLSRDNTRKIESVCGDQLRSLGKGDTTINSARGKQEQPDERPAPVDTKP